MSSPVDAPTTILSPTSVSSTGGNTALFEQANDSVHDLKVGGKRRKSRSNKRKTNKGKKSKRKTFKTTTARTFLNKFMVMKK